jgi:hypothetical protein
MIGLKIRFELLAMPEERRTNLPCGVMQRGCLNRLLKEIIRGVGLRVRSPRRLTARYRQPMPPPIETEKVTPL